MARKQKKRETLPKQDELKTLWTMRMKTNMVKNELIELSELKRETETIGKTLKIKGHPLRTNAIHSSNWSKCWELCTQFQVYSKQEHCLLKSNPAQILWSHSDNDYKVIIMVLKHPSTPYAVLLKHLRWLPSDELSKCLTHIQNTNCVHSIAWHRISANYVHCLTFNWNITHERVLMWLCAFNGAVVLYNVFYDFDIMLFKSTTLLMMCANTGSVSSHAYWI